MDAVPHQGRQSAAKEETRQSQRAVSDEAKQYAFALGNRVKSFDVDPLHSAADLSYLARYLKAPFQKPSKRQHPFENNERAQSRTFITQHLLQPGKPPTTRSFDDAISFTGSAAAPPQNEVLFLTGRPSADWLNCLGSKYSLDYRFLHQHLGPLLSSQRQHWNAGPDLPSRSMQVLTLRIPTVVFVGSRGRNLDIRQLEIAREKCSAQIRRAFLSLQNSAASEAGRSIIRRLEVHDGSTLMMEQQMTATVVRRGNFWTIIIWSDAGNEMDHTHIPVPPTSDFAPVASDLAFCPAFFDNKFTQAHRHSDEPNQERNTVSRQPLALLSTRYGTTIDWTSSSMDSPLAVIQELFSFSAASTLQYVNMLDRALVEIAERNDFPSYEHTKLETTVQYDYARASLIRLQQNCSETLAFLKAPPATWADGQTPDVLSVDITNDFDFLLARATSLIRACEDGKATLLSNDSVQAANRSAQEAKLVTELTKATNRLTFIFLPISFITSVFGMNFAQFGQGPLTIWIWVGIAIPMLIISVAIVERGKWMQSRWRRWRRGRSELQDEKA